MRRPVRALLAALALVGVVALAPAAPASAAPAPLPIDTPGSTAPIRLISSTTRSGWRYDSYRNTAYVCAVSGFNTFTIATKVGTPDDAVRPLWVFMHGGGVGYFRPDGSTNGDGQKTEESPATQIQTLERGGLLDRIEAAPAGFRLMAVSMCNHDIYAGSGLADPYNPNRKPDGSPRTVDGLFATKAAVQFALQTRPTDDFFLHGGSAGSFGSFGVAWALEEQGLPPAGVVGDSGVLFREWQVANADSPVCGRRGGRGRGAAAAPAPRDPRPGERPRPPGRRRPPDRPAGAGVVDRRPRPVRHDPHDLPGRRLADAGLGRLHARATAPGHRRPARRPLDEPPAVRRQPEPAR